MSNLTDAEIADALALCEEVAKPFRESPHQPSVSSVVEAAFKGWPRALRGLQEARQRVAELENRCQCYEAMKEGVAIRIANVEAEVQRLRADRQTMMDTKAQEGKIVMALGAEVEHLQAELEQTRRHNAELTVALVEAREAAEAAKEKP